MSIHPTILFLALPTAVLGIMMIALELNLRRKAPHRSKHDHTSH